MGNKEKIEVLEEIKLEITFGMKVFAVVIALLWTVCLFNYGVELGEEGPRTKVIAPSGTADVEITTITVQGERK